MEIIADLEVHSRFARAVSSQMTIANISHWAEKKGIQLIGTGDFTHPMWLSEIESNLEEIDGSGTYKLKNSTSATRFLLTSEISCICKHKGKVRRIHILVYFPNIEKVKLFNKELIKRGCNLSSDGRPIIGLTVRNLAEIALKIDEKALIIPAHAWTPWFGYFGHFGGYDSLEEGFEDLSKYIYAIETGLSSDPAMNWKIEELGDRQLVSFGDAHSLQKLGREATIFDLDNISFLNIFKAIKGENKNIKGTIEFYPEEGKYHYSGHLKCGVVRNPNEVHKLGKVCPVCGTELTIGVASRIHDIGKINIETDSKVDKFGVRWIYNKAFDKPGYVMLVPLQEIISESLGFGVGSKRVVNAYDEIIEKFGNEFQVLLKTNISEIEKYDFRIAQAISKVRGGDIVIEPGYDGVFGKVKIWPKKEISKDAIDQGILF
jgi:uncharacterized protein (TIGR00375 family)